MRLGSKNLARAVIFDPVAQNLRATRYGLYEAGFRDIEGFSDISELQDRLAHGAMELLVAEASDGGEVHRLVRALRKGNLTENPFAVVFLTSWRSDARAVTDGLNCGADDIILRPFSSVFIAARVRAAVEHRKRFIVTGDYLGPDRRGPAAARTGVAGLRLFDPPNTLKAAVHGDRTALGEAAAAVEAFKLVVRKERAVRLAVRVGFEAQLAVEGRGPAGAVLVLARELFVAVDPDHAEAAKLAAAMMRALSSGDDIQKGLRLARELALGVCVLCGDGANGEAPYVAEIETLLSAVRAGGSRAA